MLDFIYDRRNFLRVGSIGAGLSAVGLSDYALAQDALSYEDKAVIWVWLGGGPTQFETFHAPNDTVPTEWQPINGAIHDPKTNITLGADWTELAKHTNKLNVVNSFSHKDSSHRQGTHFMMTGHYNPERTTTSIAKYPSFGSIVSAVYGTNHPQNGVPTYVKQGKIEGEQPAFLGGAHKPFDPSNKDNLTPRIETVRFSDRKGLLDALDRGNRVPSEEAQSFSRIGNTAYNVILGNAKEAFDIDKEPEAMREKYGKGGIGDQMLLARRLAQFGTKFVTVHYGGWDMHGNIKKSLEGKVPPLDKALAAFVDDIYESGISEKVLLVVTGEFGRTRLNQNGGRDHWPSITPMLLSGGSYDHGRVIGRSDKAYYPTESKVGPIDVAATLFDHFQIDTNIQKVDQSGRPRYLLEGDGRVFLS